MENIAGTGGNAEEKRRASAPALLSDISAPQVAWYHDVIVNWLYVSIHLVGLKPLPNEFVAASGFSASRASNSEFICVLRGCSICMR